MIYVASSWRNPRYEGILDCLTQWNIAHYNWRDEEGFHWSDVMGEIGIQHDLHRVEHWTDPIKPETFTAAMHHERAKQGFERDMKHLREAEAVILLLECGKSAHLEAGWAAGAGKPTALYMTGPLQPELMYGMFDIITSDISELMQWASEHSWETILGPGRRDVYSGCTCSSGNRSVVHTVGCKGQPILRVNG